MPRCGHRTVVTTAVGSSGSASLTSCDDQSCRPKPTTKSRFTRMTGPTGLHVSLRPSCTNDHGRLSRQSLVHSARLLPRRRLRGRDLAERAKVPAQLGRKEFWRRSFAEQRGSWGWGWAWAGMPSRSAPHRHRWRRRLPGIAGRRSAFWTAANDRARSRLCARSGHQPPGKKRTLSCADRLVFTDRTYRPRNTGSRFSTKALAASR
jgi:hypothetical protein